MQSQHNAAISGGTSGALILVANWVLGFWHIAIPPEVQAAFMILITTGMGYLLRTKAAPDPVPITPAAGA